MDLVLLLFLIYLKICEHFILKENFMNFFSKNNKILWQFPMNKKCMKIFRKKIFYEKFLLKIYFVKKIIIMKL